MLSHVIKSIVSSDTSAQCCTLACNLILLFSSSNQRFELSLPKKIVQNALDNYSSLLLATTPAEIVLLVEIYLVYHVAPILEG